jgi:hypothetical protein
LSSRADHGVDYIIATTKLINGSTLIESLIDPLENNLRHSSLFD